jgi:hypothetical protein
MSLVDSIFSSIPGPLISQFGINATYVKTSQNQTYNPTTGTVLGATTEIAVKIVIADLKPEEKSDAQHSMIKIIISASSLGSYYPRVSDSIKYAQDGRTRVAEIISINNYRGDDPIMHTVIARLS